MARILFTGGFGTIGRWAVREALRRGHEVTVFELSSPRCRKAARALQHPALRVVWGDLRDREGLDAVVAGHDHVIHLAFILTPTTERQPDLARAVNVVGTENLLAACAAAPRPPRFLFGSSVEVFGKNRHLEGPRRVTDPAQATSVYTAQKIECEGLVRASGLDHAIVRFGAVIDITLKSSHELMFEFPLDVRFEVIHPADAALAIVRATEVEAVWGRGALLLLGGGPSCQTTYGSFLDTFLEAMGIGALPREAFTREDYPSDWLDSEEAQALLDYQRHCLADILAEIKALIGWRKAFIPLARPLVRRSILAGSRYYHA